MNTLETVLSNSVSWAPEFIFPGIEECEIVWNAESESSQLEKSELRRRVVELTFLTSFGREVGATLELRAALDTAARLLYGHFCFDQIEFILFASYGGIRVKYDALVEGGAISQASGRRGGKPAEVRGFRSLGLSEPKLKSMQGRDIKITLPANAGVLVLSSAEQVNRGMDSFLDGIGETFFVAVKNALEHGVVKERSLRDSLTGLFNRRVLEEMLGMEMGRREPVPLALIVLDLDNFKKVNDTFGHPAGDEVLSATGAILRKGCRPNDIVARHGGEEFAVLLSGVSCEVALKVAERLRTKIAEHKFTFADTQTGITASIGVAFIANGGITADEFLSRADQALYHAKQNGKNRVSVFGLGVFKPAEQKIVRLCEGKRVGRSALIAA